MRCTKGNTRARFKIVAINDLGDANTNAHLTRFDTVHGRFRGEVHVDGDSMVVNGDRIRVIAQRDPSKLPWRELGVDFNHDPASSTYDATLTKVIAGTLVKVCAWYDNEWGFSNRMLDTTLAWSKAA